MRALTVQSHGTKEACCASRRYRNEMSPGSICLIRSMARSEFWQAFACRCRAVGSGFLWVAYVSCDESFVIAAVFESELTRGLDAPAVARRLVADWFAPALSEGTLAAARLLVSEIVTNAVRHGRGTIMLRARLFEDRLLVEVMDQGGGFEPKARERDIKRLGVGGWGFSIVDAESSRWGVCPGSAHVWFELERSALRLEPAGCG